MGIDDLHAIIDEHGHNAAHHPRARQQADEQQDDDGRADAAHGAVDFGLQLLPFLAEMEHGDKGGDARGEDERQLARAGECVDAIDADDDSQEDNQKGNRSDGQDVGENIPHNVRIIVRSYKTKPEKPCGKVGMGDSRMMTVRIHPMRGAGNSAPYVLDDCGKSFQEV